MASLAAAACTDRAAPTSATPTVAEEPAAGRFVAGPPSAATQPSIAALAADNRLIQPVDSRMTVYRRPGSDRLAVTATLVTLAGEASARATYNGWLARYGFMPAVERFTVDLGDEALRLELGWPPLHALICRTGDRFLLVEADALLPATVRARALEDIALRALTAANDGTD